ncbi:MAG: type II toxin-antitoxin system RelE/ParE family toxin [Bryobacteraceae bacterium]
MSKLLTGREQAAMEQSIAADPERHPTIPGTGGFRKARWGRHGSGKRGGVRLIYYFAVLPDSVYLADIYAKNERENLSDAQKNSLKKIVDQIKRRGA